MRFAMILAGLALASCTEGQRQRAAANWDGWSRVCIAGVTYLQFPSGATVELDLNGKPRACDAR